MCFMKHVCFDLRPMTHHSDILLFILPQFFIEHYYFIFNHNLLASLWCFHWPEKKHNWAVYSQVSIIHLLLKFDGTQNDYTTQMHVFLPGVELKNISSCLRSLINSSILGEWSLLLHTFDTHTRMYTIYFCKYL